MAVWLSYLPAGLIQERDNLHSAYEIWMPELNWRVGWVEQYWSKTHGNRLRWRTLDHRFCDWRSGYKTREEAAQDLVTSCPRTVALIAQRRERVEKGLYKVKLP